MLQKCRTLNSKWWFKVMKGLTDESKRDLIDGLVAHEATVCWVRTLRSFPWGTPQFDGTGWHPVKSHFHLHRIPATDISVVSFSLLFRFSTIPLTYHSAIRRISQQWCISSSSRHGVANGMVRQNMMVIDMQILTSAFMPLTPWFEGFAERGTPRSFSQDQEWEIICFLPLGLEMPSCLLHKKSWDHLRSISAWGHWAKVIMIWPAESAMLTAS